MNIFCIHIIIDFIRNWMTVLLHPKLIHLWKKLFSKTLESLQ